MKKLALIGASGYAGLEFCRWVSQHPELEIVSLMVSPQSVYLGQTPGQFCAELAHLPLPALEASTDDAIARLPRKWTQWYWPPNMKSVPM
ncbi:MAG: hypothetical protein OIF34_07145 [Porticoccaceae bacterium]|nr:hypothetical protein [Porticoccaceae bacterium]